MPGAARRPASPSRGPPATACWPAPRPPRPRRWRPIRCCSPSRARAPPRAAAAGGVEPDPLLQPFEGATLPPARLAELKAEAVAILRDKIRPAQRDFATFLEKEYVPASRKALAARTLPGGEAYY